MKRKMTVLLSGTLLVVGMFMANSIADIAHYYTRTRTRVGSLTNNSGYYRTGYFIPNHDGGIAQIQICNYSGSFVYMWDSYPEYPQNTDSFSCPMPSGSTRSVFVKPAIDGQYIWGDIEYYMG